MISARARATPCTKRALHHRAVGTLFKYLTMPASLNRYSSINTHRYLAGCCFVPTSPPLQHQAAAGARQAQCVYDAKCTTRTTPMPSAFIVTHCRASLQKNATNPAAPAAPRPVKTIRLTDLIFARGDERIMGCPFCITNNTLCGVEQAKKGKIILLRYVTRTG